MGKIWPVQDAKARFSELLRAAEKEPQVITYRGEPKFEVRVREKTGKAGKPKTLIDWWLSAPKVPEFELPPRKRDRVRKIF
jgi:prevent-host-death family protein